MFVFTMRFTLGWIFHHSIVTTKQLSWPWFNNAIPGITLFELLPYWKWIIDVMNSQSLCVGSDIILTIHGQIKENIVRSQQETASDLLIWWLMDIKLVGYYFVLKPGYCVECLSERESTSISTVKMYITKLVFRSIPLWIEFSLE